MDWIYILISALVSGLIGVVISIWYYKRNEIRRTKFQVLKQLLGNRNHIEGQSFTEALNIVSVVFYDSRDVLTALKALDEMVVSNQKIGPLINQKLLDLFMAMCRNLKINIGPLTEDFFLHAFNIRHY